MESGVSVYVYILCIHSRRMYLQGRRYGFPKKCQPPWLADEENFWVYFALDRLIFNCFVWNRRLK